MTEPASLGAQFQSSPTGLGALLSSLAWALRDTWATALGSKAHPSQLARLAPEEPREAVNARAKRLMRSGD